MVMVTIDFLKFSTWLFQGFFCLLHYPLLNAIFVVKWDIMQLAAPQNSSYRGLGRNQNPCGGSGCCDNPIQKFSIMLTEAMDGDVDPTTTPTQPNAPPSRPQSANAVGF